MEETVGRDGPLVAVERPGGHVAVVTLDRPPVNALSRAARDAFTDVLATLETDSDVRCVVLTGRGRAFSAGADLGEVAAQGADGDDERAVQAFLAGFDALVDAVEAARFPVVAAVNGHCLGGGLELALGCDVRLASTAATFVCSGVNVGLLASFARLPRLIGEGRAKHLLLTGETWDAAAAHAAGLVTGVHEQEALLPAAVALAERIASRAPLSVETTKDAVHRARRLDDAGVAALHLDAFLRLRRTADHAEALAARRERREPRFGRA